MPAALEALARKHRCTVQELPGHLAATEREIDSLANSERSFAEFEIALSALSGEYDAAAARLTRRAHAGRRALGQRDQRAHAGARHAGRPLRGEPRARRGSVRAARYAIRSSSW